MAISKEMASQGEAEYSRPQTPITSLESVARSVPGTEVSVRGMVTMVSLDLHVNVLSFQLFI